MKLKVLFCNGENLLYYELKICTTCINVLFGIFSLKELELSGGDDSVAFGEF